MKAPHNKQSLLVEGALSVTDVMRNVDEASTHAVITVGKGSSSMRMGSQTAGEPHKPDAKTALAKLKALAKKWGAKSTEVLKD